MPLNVWTKPTGWNFGQQPGTNISVASGNFIVGYQYVIQTVGNTDFKKIGAASNSVGIVFTATNNGAEAGPVETVRIYPDPLNLSNYYDRTTVSPGTGVASRLAFSERKTLEISLPVQNSTGVIYNIISGKLPSGLRLEGNKIVGSSFEVPRVTDFTFCIRASKDGQISDRTFTITIEGEDKPEFVTPAGLLNIGDDKELFVMDGSYVNYQLQVIDNDTTTGQKLSYFIARGDGELPPGLILTNDGRIVGFTQPTLAIRPEDGDGTYSNSSYDAVAYDFAFVPTNGYDSYIYDSVFFDFALQQNRPRKLNRTYEFAITVTDGDSFSKRKFKIFVVGDDYFRADNTTWLDGDSLFTADVTYLRPPTWITSSYLGLYRANNYITLILDTYDTENVIYSLEQINADCRAKTRKIATGDNSIGGYHISITLPTSTPVINSRLTFAGLVAGSTTVHSVINVVSLPNNEFRLTLYEPLQNNIPDEVDFLIGSLSQLPPGMSFDENNSEVFGLVPYQPAITKTYKFTVTAAKISDSGEFAKSPKVFTVDLLGEVDSILSWDSPSDLGTINANFVSTLSVKANSNIANNTILYTITSGRLPPGLSLDLDGEIIGKVNQYATLDSLDNIISLGLTTFDFTSDVTTFDGDNSSIDRTYEFTIKAQDQYGYSAISKTFRISVDTPNQLVYSNIKVKPFLKTSQRTTWREFINNATIFSPLSIYRPNDENFGIQTELSMLVFAGIETKEAAAYVSAMGLNHKRKRFHFGEIKKSTAFVPGTKTAVYEVIYVEMLDPLEPNGKKLANKIENLSLQPKKITVDANNSIWSRNLSDLIEDEPYRERPDQIITVDSQGYEVSNPNPSTYFPNSISIWRDRFKKWTNGNESFSVERNYLPLWMRSIQPGSKQEIDFQLAVPLCYCKVGTADDVLLNIKNYIKTTGFTFNQLDYTADRYIIDSVEGLTADKYLVFRNDRITI
jgi:hypothetical protein